MQWYFENMHGYAFYFTMNIKVIFKIKNHLFIEKGHQNDGQGQNLYILKNICANL